LDADRVPGVKADLKHRKPSEENGWYCWCIPKVHFYEGAVVVIHNAPEDG